MVDKVDINFGGSVNANVASMTTIVQTYLDIASTYNLETTNFDIVFNDNQEVIDATFGYFKEGLNETDLQTFNDTWKSICTQYNIQRSETQIMYYIGD